MSTCLGNTIILLAALVILGLSSSSPTAEAAPYQELEPRKGHVPVYIRHGDEPLSEIHPGLAEAFKEGQSKGLEAESLVSENPVAETTSAPAASSTTPASPTPSSSSTESDIASFDAIKAKTE